MAETTSPPSDKKAYLKTETGETFHCQFNPAELTIAKSNSWKSPQAKGGNAPALNFEAGQSGTLTLSLTLDTTVADPATGKAATGGNVTEHTDRLLALMTIDQNLKDADPGRNKGRPPWVTFHWGSLESFKAVVERLQIKFTFFATDGTPLRAKAELTLKQFADEGVHPLQNPTSHTPTLRRIHRLQQGETLDRVAATYYGDHSRWRLIAESNGVEDPFRVPVGAALVIPQLPGRRRG